MGEWSAARPGRTLPPGKTRYPLYRRLGGPQGRSGRAENLVPQRDSIPDRPARSSVAIPTELPGPHDDIKHKIQYRLRPSQATIYINPLTPNDPYSDRTAPLTSKRCILYIYSTNIGTEYFEHGIYSPFFPFKMQFVS